MGGALLLVEPWLNLPLVVIFLLGAELGIQVFGHANKMEFVFWLREGLSNLLAGVRLLHELR